MLPLPLLLALATSADSPGIDFARDIRPILSDRCFLCHGPDEEAREGGFRLDLREEALADLGGYAPIVPGQPAASELIARVRASSPDRRMPPPESKLELSPQEILTLEGWIRAGAHYSRHWSFVAPRRSPLPEPRRADWARDPIDLFVLARLETEGLEPAPELDRAGWLRRASFDLCGLPPTLAELDHFLAAPEPDAYERELERLFASPQHAERMASLWLDAARYADTYGYQSDVAREVWPWRDWVIDSYARNQPYDEFLSWQLAGDLLPEATRESRLATAFNRLHRQTNEGGSTEEEYRVEYVADRVQTFATTALGLTMECARCHDHKFDPLAQRDFYGFFAFFDDIDESGLYSHFTNAVPTPALDLPTPEQERELDALEQAVARAQAQLLRLPLAAPASAPATAAGAARGPDEVGDLQAFFRFDALEGESLRDALPGAPAGRLAGGQARSEGFEGRALEFSGDDPALFPELGHFRRSDPFTLGLRLWLPRTYERAVVLHRSRAWTDSGSRGYELLIEEGRASAALIHFWPGDAVRVRTREALPLEQWFQLTLSWDGSSRAAGLKLYLDGRPVELEVVRDHLTRTILGGDIQDLTLGERFRDKGLAGGRVDDLFVAGRELSASEVAWISSAENATTLLAALAARAEAPTEAVVDAVANATADASAEGTADASAEGTADASAEGTADASVDAQAKVAATSPLAAAPASDAPLEGPAQGARVEALERLRQARRARDELRDGIRQIMTMAATPQPKQAHLLHRGSYLEPREVVEPHTPAALSPWPEGAPHDRLGLARWLFDPRHPLTARVEVNRLWQLAFGTGLVSTPDDFGSQGSPPSHPELLDALALDLIESGWNRRALLQRMLLSATYRQESRAGARALELDPSNRLLSHAPRKRLSAEMLRDAALWNAGLLVERVGGPPVKPYQPAGLWKEKSGAVYVPDTGEGLWRRSLYTFWKRTSPPPSMMILDAAKRDVCVVKRQSTSTPLQALLYWNDPQFVEAARGLAQRTLREAPASDEGRLEFAFRTLCSRAPTSAQRALLLTLVREQRASFRAQPAQAQALLTVGASPHDAGLDPVELASWSVLVQTIQSFDAAISTP